VRGNKEYWRDVPMVKYGDNDDYSRVGQHPYADNHVILPEIMKDNGYTTAMFGKWAGGHEGSHSTPDKRGIDEYFGYICQYQAHLYYPNFLNRYSKSLGDTTVVRVTLNENIAHPQKGEGYARRTQYSADIIHNKAMAWLRNQNSEQPFFAVLTYTLPHAELVQPQDSLVEHYRAKFATDIDWIAPHWTRYNTSMDAHAQFAAMVSRLDKYVGEILDELQAKGLAENTLVIFTSDNGPHAEGGADPDFFGYNATLRGIKRHTHEGGVRVPFIAWWPGSVEAGVENDHILAFYDMMATCSELIGVEDYASLYNNDSLTTDHFDGISFAPTLLGQGKQQQHEFLYWEFEETDQVAVRMGNWKMVCEGGIPHLYNLAEDLHEDHDIADQHPDIVRQMIEIAHSQHTESPHFKVTLPPRY
jgi:arylsulfatase A-like enzyme